MLSNRRGQEMEEGLSMSCSINYRLAIVKESETNTLE